MNEQDWLVRDAQRALDRDDCAGCLAAADEALQNDPSNAIAMCLSATALLKLGNTGLALQIFNVASKLSPDDASIWHNMGRCMHERIPEQAYRAFMKAQALQPDDVLTLSALCNVASTLGRHAEAVDWAERCFKMHGHHRDAAHNASFALFALGEWERAWKLFRGSMDAAGRTSRNYHHPRETPRWAPFVHKGARVVLYGEQGIGDEIMYASMIPAALEQAKATGSQIIIECDERNAGLFKRSFPEAAVYGTRAQRYCEWVADEHVTHRMEFGGLGEHFAKQPFAGKAFLRGESVRSAMWNVYLDGAGRVAHPRVGLAWTGGSWATGRARRSIPFELIRDFIQAHPHVDFVCLEYEDRRDELAGLPNVLNPHWATRKGADYDDLAALVSELDLVISVTTSVVDLAGALGVPTWALCDAHPQWRYSDFLGPDQMFFYESVRTFRQKEWYDWAPVIGKMSKALHERYAEAARPA